MRGIKPCYLEDHNDFSARNKNQWHHSACEESSRNAKEMDGELVREEVSGHVYYLCGSVNTCSTGLSIYLSATRNQSMTPGSLGSAHCTKPGSIIRGWGRQPFLWRGSDWTFPPQLCSFCLGMTFTSRVSSLVPWQLQDVCVCVHMHAQEWGESSEWDWAFPLFLLLALLLVLLLNSGVWTQGLAVAKDMLYPFSHASSPFSCFQTRSHFFPGPATEQDHSICSFLCNWDNRCASPGLACLLRWGSCQGWPQTVILLISASRVAGSTGVSHFSWLLLYLLWFCLQDKQPSMAWSLLIS
jgi:hypothetical protein